MTNKTAVFTRVRMALTKAEVDADILGNASSAALLKGKKFKNDNERLAFVRSSEYKAASCKAEARKAELHKLVPHFTGAADPKITKAELVDYITSPAASGGLGLTLALTQCNKWLEGTEAAVAKQTAPVQTVESDTGVKEGNNDLQRISSDEVVMKKSQVQFFEMLWSVTTEEQKAQVKDMVAKAAREAVLAKAEAEAIKAAEDISSMFGD